MLKLSDFNVCSKDDFVAALANVFEYSPWIAEQAAALRPFAGVNELFAAMRSVVDRAPEEVRLALIRAHPDLANKTQRAAGLTAESQRRTEQRRPGPAFGCRICGVRARQQRLPRQIRLSLYRLRSPPHPRFHPARFRTPAAERCQGRGANLDRGNLPDRGAASRSARRVRRQACRCTAACRPMCWIPTAAGRRRGSRSN